MKLAAFLTLIAITAQAQPADAPVIERDAMEIPAGTVIPFDGVCMTHGKSIEVAKRIASAEATVAEDKGRVSAPVLVLAIVGAVVLGAAAGAGVAYALKR